MKVAIIHFWLVGMRGGEKVLEALCRLFPQADIYTHVYAPESVSPLIRKHTVRTTFINSLPLARRWYQKYLPLMPLALEQLDLTGYDLVISSESGPAKGVLTDALTPHICYCHTPMRYLWDFYPQYLKSCGMISRLLFRLAAHPLRIWDVASANRVDHFVANSAHVAKRIAKHYRRESEVIHPPVDVTAFAPENGAFTQPGKDAPYLCYGHLVSYKRADLAVRAFSRSGRKLIVAGDGEERAALERVAGPSVRFAGRQSQQESVRLLRECRALIFPGEEDFGIVPVEAQAAGRPVIAYGRGGALETLREGETGLFFREQSVDALNDAVERFERMEDAFDPAKLAAHAATFAPEHFERAFMAVVDRVLTGSGPATDR